MNLSLLTRVTAEERREGVVGGTLGRGLVQSIKICAILPGQTLGTTLAIPASCTAGPPGATTAPATEQLTTARRARGLVPPTATFATRILALTAGTASAPGATTSPGLGARSRNALQGKGQLLAAGVLDLGPHNLPDADQLTRITHVAVRQVRDMNDGLLSQPQVHEGGETGHAGDNPIHDPALGQAQGVGVESKQLGFGQLTAWVPARIGQLPHEVSPGLLVHLKR